MTTQDSGSDPQAERSPDPDPTDQSAEGGHSTAQPNQTHAADVPDAESEQFPPARKPLNLSGWIALVLASVAFAGSLLVAWPQAVLLAALALALSLTGVVRVYRGRATNKGATYTALALALATVILGFVWANRAQPCIPVANDTEKFSACYAERTGLL